jgi:DNA replication and repair protein RecF
MSLIELAVEDLRCLERIRLELHPAHNLIWGGNGSGKTSLLEAIFLLGRGRSFRTRSSERLIRHGQPRLISFGRTDDVPSQALGVEVSRSGRTAARINGAAASSLTELSEAFPVQVIDPGIHKLVEEGGYRRRRWMDWLVFHVEPHFAAHWTRYARVLKQRNAALRGGSVQVESWDVELVRLGELIADSRSSVIDRLQPAWRETAQGLCGLEVELHYVQGWPRELSLREALVNSRARDQLKGTTHVGPHRADIAIRWSGRLAREALSRGQQKLVAIAMVLSQLQLLKGLSRQPTLLLDDPAAELDGAHLENFIHQVRRLPGQLILTALHDNASPFGVPEKVFHVERGRVRPV